MWYVLRPLAATRAAFLRWYRVKKCAGSGSHDSLRARALQKKRPAARVRASISTRTCTHVLPREFANHPRVRAAEYDVEEGYNLLLLPRRPSVSCARMVHAGGHAAYNAYVRSSLDACGTAADVVALLSVLHAICRGRRAAPWR